MKKRSIFAFLTLGIFVAYHRFKERRDIRDLAEHGTDNLKKVGLSKETFALLPRWGVLANGRPMEWMNLIVIGEEAEILSALQKGGWTVADRVSPGTLLRAFWAIITGGQYLSGPVTPIFIGDKPENFGAQKPTEANVFRERHHARFWKTDLTDKKARTVWIAHASFDKGIKGQGRFNFPPTHEIDADIDAERKVIVDDMIKGGAKLLAYIQFQQAGEGLNGFNDAFKSDGRAAVLEIK